MFHLKYIFNCISKPISHFFNFKAFKSLFNETLYFEYFFLNENNWLKNNEKKLFQNIWIFKEFYLKMYFL